MAFKLFRWRHRGILRQDAYNALQQLDGLIDFSRYARKCGDFKFSSLRLKNPPFLAGFNHSSKRILFEAPWPYLAEPTGLTIGVHPINGLVQTSTNAHDYLQILLAHESGHQVFSFLEMQGLFRLNPTPFTPFAALTNGARQNGSPISATAAYSDSEYFAETFAAYFLFRGSLANLDPQGHALIQSVDAAPW